LSSTISIVLHIVECLSSLIHHQPYRVCKVGALTIRIPGSIDNIYFCLNLWVSISRLADYNTGVQLFQLPDKVHHVRPSYLVGPCSFLQVQVNTITAILFRPLGNFHCHLLSCFPGCEPVPGVRLNRVGVSSYSKHDHSVGRNSSW